MPKVVKAAKKKRVNGYKMPEPLPKGEILTDVAKQEWILGPSIGKGGFGEIYSAAKSGKQYNYVVKIEPHENGPLFVEMHVYMKVAKPADIQDFQSKTKLKTFGMPAYLGSGSHEFQNEKYRFIVMEKFGTDLDKLRTNNGGALSLISVFQIALQLTYVLEYIHSFGYVHADIKGSNILFGITPQTQNQAYLVDFGLATKFTTADKFTPNPKKAHDGTIEYLSRDAHHGVATRRGDFEILAYNIIHWLGGKLPWEGHLSDPKVVQQKKEEAMRDIPKFLKTAFGDTPVPSALTNLLNYVDKMTFNEEPKYKKIRDFFISEIKKAGGSVDDPLDCIVNRRQSLKRRLSSNKGTPEKKVKQNNITVRRKVTTKKNVLKASPKKPQDEKVKTPTIKRKLATKKKTPNENSPKLPPGEIMTQAMKEVLAKRDEKKKPVRKVRAKV